MWADFGQRLRDDPSVGRMLLAFGAQMLQPGDVGTNFGKAALAMSQIAEEDRQRKFQEDRATAQEEQANKRIAQTDRQIDQADERLKQSQVQLDAQLTNEQARIEQAAKRLDIQEGQLQLQKNADGRAELTAASEAIVREKTIEKLTMELEAMQASGLTGFSHSNILVKIAQEQMAANPSLSFAEAASKAVEVLTPKSSSGSKGQITPAMLLELAVDIQNQREETAGLTNSQVPEGTPSPVQEVFNQAKQLEELLNKSNLK